MAREVVSREFQKITAEDKESEIEEIRPVEEIEKVLPEEDSREQIEKEAVRHINLKV
jgi:hypothetical protein